MVATEKTVGHSLVLELVSLMKALRGESLLVQVRLREPAKEGSGPPQKERYVAVEPQSGWRLTFQNAPNATTLEFTRGNEYFHLRVKVSEGNGAISATLKGVYKQEVMEVSITPEEYGNCTALIKHYIHECMRMLD